MKDRLVEGVRSKKIRGRLLQETDLKLQKAIDMCKSAEQSESQLRSMKPDEVEVNKLKYRGKSEKKSYRRPAYQTCKFCDKTHPFEKDSCPAFKHHSKKCNRTGHLEKYCYGKKKPLRQFDDVSSDDIEQSSDDNTDLDTDYEYVQAFRKINTNAEHERDDRMAPVYETILVDKNIYADLLWRDGVRNVVVKCQLDTAAACNVIGNKQLQKYFSTMPKILDSSVKLKCFSGKIIESLGKVAIKCHHNQRKYKLLFEVVQEDHIPVTVREDVVTELERLEKRGIIKKVNVPTNWTSNLVIVKKKNNQLRICLDPYNLNKALKIPHVQSTTIEEITPKLHKARYFTTMDAKNGFWHMKLDDKSAFPGKRSQHFSTFLNKNQHWNY